MQELPSPVIVRGLLLGYAGATRMDEEELLSLYAEALQARRDERNAGTQRKKISGSQGTPAPLIAINSERLKKINLKGLVEQLYNRFPFLKKYLSVDLLVGGILVIALAAVIIWAAASTLSLTAERVASLATLPGRSEILASGATLVTDTSAMITMTCHAGCRPGCHPGKRNWKWRGTDGCTRQACLPGDIAGECGCCFSGYDPAASNSFCPDLGG